MMMQGRCGDQTQVRGISSQSEEASWVRRAFLAEGLGCIGAKPPWPLVRQSFATGRVLFQVPRKKTRRRSPVHLQIPARFQEATNAPPSTPSISCMIPALSSASFGSTEHYTSPYHTRLLFASVRSGRLYNRLLCAATVAADASLHSHLSHNPARTTSLPPLHFRRWSQ